MLSEAPPDELPEALRCRYRQEGVLGRGGMGVVLEARDLDLDRPVAVKCVTLPAEGSAGPSRFLREARALAALDHAQVLTVFDFGTEGRFGYLVTELVEGASMDSLPPGVDPGPPWRQVGEALDAVHAAGLLHRDVKPANVVLSPERGAVLIDFGLALGSDAERVTRTGIVVGTPAYMAPETAFRLEHSAASDWFAWGVSLYQLREGALPFTGRDLQAAAQGRGLPALRFTNLGPTDPERGALAALLAPDPADRPTSWRQVQRLLEEGAGRSSASRRTLSGSKVLAPVEGKPAHGKAVPRPVVASAGAAMLLAAVLAWSLTSPWGPRSPPQPATQSASSERDGHSSDLVSSPEIQALRRALAPFATRDETGTDAEGKRRRIARLADPRVPIQVQRLLDALAAFAARLVAEADTSGDGLLPEGIADLVELQVLPVLARLHDDVTVARLPTGRQAVMERGLSESERIRFRQDVESLKARLAEIDRRVREAPPWPTPPPGEIGEALLLLQVWSDLSVSKDRAAALLPPLVALLSKPPGALSPGWRVDAGLRVVTRLLLLPRQRCRTARPLYHALRTRLPSAWSSRPEKAASLDTWAIWTLTSFSSVCRREDSAEADRDILALADRVEARAVSDPDHVLYVASTISSYQLNLVFAERRGAGTPEGFRRILELARDIRRRRRGAPQADGDWTSPEAQPRR